MLGTLRPRRDVQGIERKRPSVKSGARWRVWAPPGGSRHTVAPAADTCFSRRRSGGARFPSASRACSLAVAKWWRSCSESRAKVKPSGVGPARENNAREKKTNSYLRLDILKAAPGLTGRGPLRRQGDPRPLEAQRRDRTGGFAAVSGPADVGLWSSFASGRLCQAAKVTVEKKRLVCGWTG